MKRETRRIPIVSIIKNNWTRCVSRFYTVDDAKHVNWNSSVVCRMEDNFYCVNRDQRAVHRACLMFRAAMDGCKPASVLVLRWTCGDGNLRLRPLMGYAKHDGDCDVFMAVKFFLFQWLTPLNIQIVPAALGASNGFPIPRLTSEAGENAPFHEVHVTLHWLDQDGRRASQKVFWWACRQPVPMARIFGWVKTVCPTFTGSFDEYMVYCLEAPYRITSDADLQRYAYCHLFAAKIRDEPAGKSCACLSNRTRSRTVCARALR